MWRTFRHAVPTVPVVFASLLAAACAGATTVPLHGSPDAYAALAGEWQGTYTGRDRNSSGSIWFKVIPGENHAHGDVVMTRTGALSAYERPDRTKAPEPPPASVLAIRFVHAEDGLIEGSLEPYWDPQCRCEVGTTFQGRHEGDRLSGTFVSRRDGVESRGRWQIKRLTVPRPFAR